ncbi:hypothetical protein [Pantanalinema sp. GBBB05]|uniref:hypothetical protein n=1 Tax=Pantanalinema sp. GBBB05 TaxID=2604139 RepID=UPI001D440663|nr:hypothetical protein [Pantanalinema sp. GBBB05]
MRSRVAGLALLAGLAIMSLGSYAAAQSRSSTIAQAQPPYNCRTREVWSPEKQAWCKKYGNQQPAIDPIGPVESQNWYNCLTKEVWSPEKRVWCDRLRTLQNTTYQVPDVGSVKLTDGKYKNASQQITVTLVNQPDLIAVGDLNGDRQLDAMVLLAVNTGGSGVFMYLAPVLQQGNRLQSGSPLLLGDRVRVQSIMIDQSRAKVDMLTHAAKDPMCCPTQKITQLFTLQMLPTLVPLLRG